METWFQNVEVAPPIEVFSLVQKFREDPHPTKVNLSVGGEYLYDNVVNLLLK